nr:hypothetical protein [Streptosporangium nondiastaticum]
MKAEPHPKHVLRDLQLLRCFFVGIRPAHRGLKGSGGDQPTGRSLIGAAFLSAAPDVGGGVFNRAAVDVTAVCVLNLVGERAPLLDGRKPVGKEDQTTGRDPPRP